ncbi:MAG: enoyl-CoA hydratase/isomerase family protein [Pirellulaceae bacterium]|nr:enoyl-CoA hydratase/isomerase family protein [Pirellulaceae bacterium]
MSPLETVTYETDGAVATVKLNRPEALNSFNTQLGKDLLAAMQMAAADSSIRAVVFGGHGRVFSAGADLKAGINGGERVRQILKELYGPALLAIAEMDKPVISAVQGSASGIGLSFALTADLVLMADNAFFLSPFATIGLVPDGGLAWILPLEIGYHRAYQLAIEAERVPAERCVSLGLANRTVPEAMLHDEAHKWAQSLAERAPLALALTKRAMRRAASLTFAEMINYEADLQAQCIDSQDCREGVTAFLTKRKPQFTGR